MDALSDVLKSVRLEGAVYRDAEFSAPWCVQAKYGIETAGDQLAGAEHVMFFHFLIEGHCKVRLASGGEVSFVPLGRVEQCGRVEVTIIPRNEF